MIWLLWESGLSLAADNMAADEALLESAPCLGHPVLRFYGWRESAASFGYFQRYVEVEGMTHLRPLVRRPTGGGLVPHDMDWTYSLIFPPSDPWYCLKARESYQRVHEWIQAAFARERVPTELAPEPKKEGPGQCFAGAEQFDVLWRKRKIAGAAQRRTRHGLLIQGSIQPPPGIARAQFQEALCCVAAERWGVAWMALHPDTTLAAHIARLTKQKYSQDAFTQRR